VPEFIFQVLENTTITASFCPLTLYGDLLRLLISTSKRVWNHSSMRCACFPEAPFAGYNLTPAPNTTLCHHPPRSEYAQMPPPNSALRRRRLQRYPTTMKYIRHFNKIPKPIRWTFANPTQRIAHLDDHRPAAATGSQAPLCLVRAGDCYTGVPQSLG
jgi:hypothetical protein